MRQRLSFNKQDSISETVFRKKVWNAFGRAILSRQDIILDFQNVEFMASTVVPKLCCFGEIAKRLGINLEIITSYKLAKYLAEMGFWDIAYENNIFYFDERWLYFETENKKKVTNALFCIEKEDLKRKYKDVFEFSDQVTEKTKCKYWVRAELVGISNAVPRGFFTHSNLPNRCKAVLQTISGLVGYSDYTSEDKILGPIVEIVHNAVWHSYGKCYFLAQKCKYDEKYNEKHNKRVGIDITIADTGCGLYKSLVLKDDEPLSYYKKDDFLRIEGRTEQNYCSIVEALFFREQYETRGLYDIISDLANEPSDHFRELHFINGNVALNLAEGEKKDINGNRIERHDISDFISNGIEGILKKRNKYFASMFDIDFSFCVDIGISVPISER